MAFLIQWSNKGCYQLQAARLNTTTDEVICQNCGKSISNVTSFAKTQLKHLKQTTKTAKVQETYSIKCEHCSEADVPSLAEGDKLVCKRCNKELTQISYPFKMMLIPILNQKQKS